MDNSGKRIGIMTWFHNNDLGAVLQMTALYEILAKFGLDPAVINYLPKTPVFLPKAFSLVDLPVSLFKRVHGAMQKWFFAKLSADPMPLTPRADEKFAKFIARLPFTAQADTLGELENLDFDAFLCGSDQIWNPSFFDDKLFLSFVRDNRKKIAYAPSIGLPQVADENVRTQMAFFISSIEHLSVRERTGADIIRDLCGRKAPVVLDPTLFLSPEEWNSLTERGDSPAGEYILCYFLGRNKEHWLHVDKIAQVLNLPVKIIPVFPGDFHRPYPTIKDVGPQDFVRCIKDAAYICTDSFHALTFSVVYGKDFSVYERFPATDPLSQNSRIYNLLQILGIENRLVLDTTSAENCVEDINWAGVYGNLDKEWMRSLDYLKKALMAAAAEVDPPKQIPTGACCGCGACVETCPEAALAVTENDLGFFSATIDTELCTSCDECQGVCPMRNTSELVPDTDGASFSFKASDEAPTPPNGEAGFELAKIYSQQGYDVFGRVYFPEEEIARHVKIPGGDIAGLESFYNKNIPSEFSGIIAEIKESEKAVVFGTPCQIAGLANLLPNERRDDFLLIDQICYGVPSYNMYRAALSRQGEDLFTRFFENGHCFIPACYECPFRAGSCADMRIGGDKVSSGTDSDGMHIIGVYTEQGQVALGLLDSIGTLVSLEDYPTAQHTNMPTFYYTLMGLFENRGYSIEKISAIYNKPFDSRRKIPKLFEKIRKKIRSMTQPS